MTGQVVMSQETSSDEMTLDLSDFETGMYVLQIVTETGVVTRQINIIK